MLITLPPAREPRCNVCGGDTFMHGPNGRLSSTRELPRCTECLSLERHRQLRRVYARIPPEVLAAMEVLQMSPDVSVERGWFASYEVSVFGGENHLDLEAIDRPDGRYDLVICNHVLEHVRDDRRGFSELLRITREAGFIQVTVPTPYTRETTKELGYPDEGAFGHWRAYGRDLVERFAEVAPEARLVQVEVFDPVTAAGGYVYFWSRSEATADRLRGWMGAS
jgi:SAM-dependent methyltransferase